MKHINNGNDNNTAKETKPAILAPAGNRAAFFAALSAGADAVYCGLKDFSARMKAENFTPSELTRLVAMAHDRGVAVYVAINTLIKPDELEKAAVLLDILARQVRPDALIVQDPGLIDLIRQSGFAGQVHLSTLAAVTYAGALQTAATLPGVTRVVLPRELNIDEIRQMAAACPGDISLEVFVHGALCYGVSGRCYWSSYLGGKSGLRGQCVQPCRRMYAQQQKSGRFFSCLDFSLDVLVKTLLTIPQISAWKIEGRKKGPHYVYYTTTAYKILRDEGHDPGMKKIAGQYLAQALGRTITHYYFLPQRKYPPTGRGEETASGRFVGKVSGGGKNSQLVPRFGLMAGDLLRIGYEDRPGHSIYKVGRAVPRQGRLHMKLPPKQIPAKGTPVFLIDRMEKTLLTQLETLESVFSQMPEQPVRQKAPRIGLPAPIRRKPAVREMDVFRSPPRSGRPGTDLGLWLSESSLQQAMAAGLARGCWFWLPPVIWPENAADVQAWIDRALGAGAARFVVNAPWQMSFFPPSTSLTVWAGPFCNLSNAAALQIVKNLGCVGAVVSPELSESDFSLLARQRPLPLGVVTAGAWPLALARSAPVDIAPDHPFVSPRKESAWVVRNDFCFWVYPNWHLDLLDREKLLKKMGYSLFIRIHEPLPETVGLKKRPGEWNWRTRLV